MLKVDCHKHPRTTRTGQETSQQYCECQLTSLCGIARLRVWWCKDFRRLKIHLRLAIAGEGGGMVQKCQEEVEELGTASQRHKNPPPTRCCMRGRWRRHRGSRWGLRPGVPWQGLASEPTPSRSTVRALFSRLHRRWGRSTLHRFDRPHIGRCRPCVGSFDFLLSR